MGNFICSVIIICLIVIFVAVNCLIVDSICEKIIKYIDQNDTESAKAVWSDKKHYLSRFHPDREIDSVTNATEFEADPARFRQAVTEIRDSEVLSLWGVL